MRRSKLLRLCLLDTSLYSQQMACLAGHKDYNGVFAQKVKGFFACKDCILCQSKDSNRHNFVSVQLLRAGQLCRSEQGAGSRCSGGINTNR